MTKEQIKQEVREKFEKETGKKDVEVYIGDDCTESMNYWCSYAHYLENIITSQQSAIDEVIKEIEGLQNNYSVPMEFNLCNRIIQIIKDKLLKGEDK